MGRRLSSINGGGWQILGLVTPTTTSLNVVLGNLSSDTGKRVVADAVQIRAVKSFVYNALGGMKQRIDREGRAVVYTFDDLGRTTDEDWYATAALGTKLNSITWGYDPASGRLTSSADLDADGAGADRAVASDSFVYDAYGRIATATRALDGITQSFVYTPTYSVRDERLGLTIANGSTLFNWSAQYDALGQTKQLTLAGYGGGPTQVADFTYDLAGQTRTLSRTQNTSSAAHTGFGYDNQGRLASLSHQQPSTSAK